VHENQIKQLSCGSSPRAALLFEGSALVVNVKTLGCVLFIVVVGLALVVPRKGREMVLGATACSCSASLAV